MNTTMSFSRLYVSGFTRFLELLLTCWTVMFVVTVVGDLLQQEDPIYVVTGIEDNKAELPCDISEPNSNSRVSIVLWYKGIVGLPIYSIDFRGNNALNGSHKNREELGERVNFYRQNGQGYLVIEPVRPEDAGEYRCRVDFYKAPTRNQRVRLNVIEPPKSVSIIDISGKEVPDSLTAKEGATLSLTCQTSSGSPVPLVTWWRGTALLPSSSYEITPDRTVKNELIIPTLTRQDLHATFTCQASNNNFSLPAIRVVTLDLDLRPIAVIIIPPDEPLSARKESHIRCQSYGSRPPPFMSWFKESKRLKHAKEFISDDRNVTTSILTFRPTEVDNGKFITCRADNPSVFGSTMEEHWKMDVHYPPTAALQLGSSLKQENLKEGDDVYFDCFITANPRTYKVDWKFQGRYLSHNVSAGIITSNQTLVLQKIKKSNMGAYSCIARNTEGDGESNEVSLKIKYAPYCRSGQKIVYGIAKHESAPIFCEVHANPPAVHYKWAFNNTNEYLDVARARFVSAGLRSTLTYTPRTEHDYGSLYCWGANEVGEQREPCTFIVIAAGPPDPVTNCSIQNETENAVYIECAEGFDGGSEQKFKIEVYETSSHQLKFNTSNSSPEFQVQGLEAGKGFLISVYAVNDKGRSSAMTLMANTLRVAERRTGMPTMFTITPVLGVLIGIVAALVLVAVAIVVVMRLRNAEDEKKKKKQRQNGETELTDKSRVTIPLKKELDELESVEEKNPDIVPCDDDHLYDDVEEKSFTKLNNVTNDRIYENVPNFNSGHRDYENLKNVRNQSNRPKQSDDIMYAELQLPNNQRPAPSRRPGNSEPTVYAQIDHTKKAPVIQANTEYEEEYSHTADTPLMGNHRESTV